MLEIGNRIKTLRKQLGLNQTEFGERIGFKQAAIGLWENGQRTVSDSAILLICEKYNVREVWLRSGSGEMFVQDSDAEAARLAREFSLSDLGKAVIKGYSELNDFEKSAISRCVKSIVAEYGRIEQAKEEKLLEERSTGSLDPDIKKELDSYRQELEQEKSTRTSSASRDSGENAG